MEKQNLTTMQQRILDFLKSELKAKGYPPSVREIGSAVGLKSTSSVFSQLATLERKGYIRRDPSKSRTIEIIDDDLLTEDLPYMKIGVKGQVAAGEPFETGSPVTDHIIVSRDLLPSSDDSSYFCVTVDHTTGVSMINAGIVPDDYLIVQECSESYNGAIVLAQLPTGATVKTYYHKDGHYRLQPENDDYKPYIISDGASYSDLRSKYADVPEENFFDSFSILGRVVGIYRKI